MKKSILLTTLFAVIAFSGAFAQTIGRTDQKLPAKQEKTVDQGTPNQRPGSEAPNAKTSDQGGRSADQSQRSDNGKHKGKVKGKGKGKAKGHDHQHRAEGEGNSQGGHHGHDEMEKGKHEKGHEHHGHEGKEDEQEQKPGSEGHGRQKAPTTGTSSQKQRG